MEDNPKKLKTLTFILDYGETIDLKNKYPISIWLKVTKHDVIKNEFSKESHDLSNGVNIFILYF